MDNFEGIKLQFTAGVKRSHYLVVEELLFEEDDK